MIEAIYVSLAKNVLDPDVKVRLAVLADTLTGDEQIRKWITSTYQKWLINEGPSTQVADLPADAPAWAKKALNEGELHQINWDEVSVQLRGLVEYLNYQVQQGNSFKSVSVPQALEGIATWHKELASKKKSAAILDEPGIETELKFPDGYSWVRVFGPDALDREGNDMGHCVGSYYKEVTEGKSVIFSLRDPKNFAHITIELSGLAVHQIKGKANDVVVPKYKKYIQPFLTFLSKSSVYPVNCINLDRAGLKPQEVIEQLELAGARRSVDLEKADVEDVIAGLTIKLFTNSQVVSADGRYPTVVDSKSFAHAYASTTSKMIFSNSGGNSVKWERFGYEKLDLNLRDVEKSLSIQLLPSELVAVMLSKAIQSGSGLRRFIRIDDRRIYDELFDTCESQHGCLVYAGLLDGNKLSTIAPLPFDLDKLYVSASGAPLGYTRKGKIDLVPDNRKSSTFSVLRNILIAEYKAGTKFGAVSKTLQLEVLDSISPLNKGVERDTSNAISHDNIPSVLRSAIAKMENIWSGKSKRFAGDAQKLVALLDSGTPFRNAILGFNHIYRTSGYMPDFMDTFFILILSKNKDVVSEAILKSPGMLRQFMAWTANPSSLYNNYVYCNVPDRVISVQKVVAAHMKDLVCLTESEIDQLLSLKCTPAFRKVLTSWKEPKS